MSNKQEETMVLVERVVVRSLEEEFNFFNTYLSSMPRANVPEQRETLSIILRSASKKKIVRLNDKYARHTQLTESSQVAANFKLTMEFLTQFARRRGGVLSRAIIVNLPPNKKVYPHIDSGEYYEIRDRYHLVLSSKGSRMLSGGQEKIFVTGDLFYFNNHVPHEAFNDSSEDRIHIIFDLLPKTFKSYQKFTFSLCKNIIVNIFSLVFTKFKS